MRLFGYVHILERLCKEKTGSNLSLIKKVNVIVPNESKLTVVTCNRTRAVNQPQTICVGVNGGTLPCVWLAHATSGESVTNNLTYLPSTTS